MQLQKQGVSGKSIIENDTQVFLDISFEHVFLPFSRSPLAGADVIEFALAQRQAANPFYAAKNPVPLAANRRICSVG